MSLTFTAYHFLAGFPLIKKCLLIGLISLLIISCAQHKKMASGIIEKPSASIVATAPVFDKQGHRGCRGLMPENTIPAMLHALDLGVTTLELDIVFTKDSVAVVSHEPFFNHDITTLPNGGFIPADKEKEYNIFKMTFAETQQYDVGLKPNFRFPRQKKLAVHKPSLAALFDSVQHYMSTATRQFPFFNIETKTEPATDNIYHPAPEKFVDMLMQVITKKKMERYVIIQSFDIRTLQYLHKKYPAVPTALLVEEAGKRSVTEQINELGFVPTIFSPYYPLVTKETVEQWHSRNVKIIPWTVNDLAKITSLKNLGVDGIISDYPDLF